MGGGEYGKCYAKEGDGIVVSRPHQARKTVMDQVSFAVTCSSPCGVVVMDNTDPFIFRPVRNEYGRKIRKDYDKGKVQAKIGDMRDIAPRTDGLSNTLTSITKDNLLGVIVCDDRPVMLKEGECVAMHTPRRAERRQGGPRFNEDGISFAVTTADRDGCAINEKGRLRIRYLTPRECMRLQAYPDDAIDRLQSVLSKSATYKVAGNSIAVCCLKAIFKGIYIDRTFRKDRQTSLERFF